MLYLVPTPIGNLGDITHRAIETLKEVELILAEDTRKTGKLLKHYNIDTRMMSYHAHNEHRMLDRVMDLLKEGKDLGLVSDAGTPGISDPGFLLVRACHKEKIAVTCLPGPSALIPAIAMSGIPCDRFHFEGFLPAKKGRQSRWKVLEVLESTIVLYESPHRIVRCLAEIEQYFGDDRQVAVIREISKIHEEVLRGAVREVRRQLEMRDSIKGEFVVVVGKAGNLKDPA